MGSKLAVVLIPVVAFVTEQRLPDCTRKGHVICHNAEVMFTDNPSNVTVTCGANMSAEFRCRYIYTLGNQSEIDDVPWWVINSKVYGKLESIPNYIYNPGTRVLQSQSINISQNNTVYQCEYHTLEGGSACAYRSKRGSLLITTCKVTNVRCEPYYRFKSKAEPSLLEELAVSFPQDIIPTLVNDAIDYTIFFSDSASSDICATHFLNSSSCSYGGVCNKLVSLDMLSHCLKKTGIHVTVLANDHNGQVNFSLSDPIKIDIINSFVSILLKETQLMCHFQSVAEVNEKFCSVASGPETEDCKNMLPEPAKSTAVNSSFVAVEIDLSFLNGSTKFCFTANATSGNKTVILRGVYDKASTTSIHHDIILSTLITSVFIHWATHHIMLTAYPY